MPSSMALTDKTQTTQILTNSAQVLTMVNPEFPNDLGVRLFWPFFPEKCMKMKEIWNRGICQSPMFTEKKLIHITAAYMAFY